MPFVGLIGCGNLGSAIAERWLENGMDRELVKAVDNHPEKVTKLGLKNSNLEELSAVEVLVLAVKPWNIAETLSHVKLAPETVVVSMAAGISLARLEEILGKKQPICRVMPNIGVKLGRGLMGIAFNESIGHGHKSDVKEILEPLGKTIEIKETDFDAFTALAGSGPAFASELLEACVLGGIAGGLSKNLSLEISLDMFSTSIDLIKSGIDFEELRFLVSSPAGTTTAGLEVMEKDGIRGTIMKTIRVASERARELGQKD